MGFNSESLIFLKHLSAQAPLGKCLTLGRQTLCAHLFHSKICKDIIGDDYSTDIYGDNVLIHEFGATSVDALDFNDNEGATIIQDLNQQLDSIYSHLQFDTILDFGTLEHLYNIPQALSTILSLCKPYGRIVHVLPSNNWCGHGYYQFSPEFFSMIYSIENNFINTKIFVSEWNCVNTFKELILPLCNSPDLTGYRTGRLQCLVCTQKTPTSILNPRPQLIYNLATSSTHDVYVHHSTKKHTPRLKIIAKYLIKRSWFAKMVCWILIDFFHSLSDPSNNAAFRKVNLLK